MSETLFKKLESYYDEMVSIRRYLHQNPEVSFKEEKTAHYIKTYYENLGIEVQGHIGGNGVVAKIYGSKPGKTIALRADFDALPIQDEKDVPYKSLVPGVMHACGHDGHTATLLVLAKALNELRDELEGTYVMIHQHAEEYAPGGAKSMIEDGCLEGVDAIFGTHLWASEPTGKIQYRVGPFMAAADRFEVSIQGKGGHGAQPHKTKDAIVTAAQLVVNLQQIVSRKVNPIDSAVVTVGSFVADNAFNVIADRAKLIGTVRTFNEDVRTNIEEEIERIVKGTCYTADSSYDYQFHRGYPAVINHKTETEFLAELAGKIDEVKWVEETEPDMGGEDFAYYLQQVKGTFFFTGARPENTDENYPHHHPKFDIDEKAMLIAAKTLGSAALNYHSFHESKDSVEVGS
ncbi:M20 family metallopeptidase [Cytobacillus oceanisediminis]|jgi:amidohydrolase|uniref:Peptidase M20 n=1 Tax=Cytobacillus oceanisediminis 2691 TaxID=1196031 RepID=A0A169FIA1_9BACI|nr:M20 family metallopeptidase [Cytobacillus oceanisediminis]MCS0825021.1 M20 family metallopeptidase [Cytobacillus firmus]AND38871.1 peptidase M20 [Cytobacillus oceanisediminis 2691]MCM3404112.1 M20 family metallopeptidase [Cytobacillus oceanisediminis]MDK7667942.1 M20 family metallopeptidase [Cytobacillus oceanisediminis]QOK27427.1 amidohydrolase [Cytobacillus oceanisediminis]